MERQIHQGSHRTPSEPQLTLKGFSGAIPLPARLAGFVSKALTLIALAVFLNDPSPRGLVNAAWFYFVGRGLSLIAEVMIGWENGRRQVKFFNSLPLRQEERLGRMFLEHHALQAFYGIHTPLLFQDDHGPIIREILAKDETEQA